MPEPTHACPGGCGSQVPYRLYACGLCWARLPKDLRGPILRIPRRQLAERGQAMADARRWFEENPVPSAGAVSPDA